AVVAQVDAEAEVGGDRLHEVLDLALAHAGAQLGPQPLVEPHAAVHRRTDARDLLRRLAAADAAQERLAARDPRPRHGLLHQAGDTQVLAVGDAVAEDVALAVVQVDARRGELPQPGREAVGERAVVAPELVDDAEPLDVADVVVRDQRQRAAPRVEPERRLAADARSGGRRGRREG